MKKNIIERSYSDGAGRFIYYPGRCHRLPKFSIGTKYTLIGVQQDGGIIFDYEAPESRHNRVMRAILSIFSGLGDSLEQCLKDNGTSYDEFIEWIAEVDTAVQEKIYREKIEIDQ